MIMFRQYYGEPISCDAGAVSFQFYKSYLDKQTERKTDKSNIKELINLRENDEI